MTVKPQKLQGTDGIRGRITSDHALDSANPVHFFLSRNLLTPSFFERYTFAFASLLKKTGLAKSTDHVVIGWDSRDKEGSFNQAAVRGIRKAGLNCLVAGILPTPAIPLYMLFRKAVGSVVLTASHNPADQNGIKLFCGYTALKLLPPDDIMLTKTIYDQMAEDISGLPLLGALSNCEKKARDFFVDFCLQPENSWIASADFSNTILVIDASKGSVASVAEKIFSPLPFKEVFLTNLEGEINEHCGVADIEGLERIPRHSVMQPGSKYHAYQTLRMMFEKSDEIRQSNGFDVRLIGLVFDGDGDRCYRLDYHPHDDELIVSSGDLLGFHQANYLNQQRNQSDAWFVNTVESDLNTAITARKMGFKPVLTGVGDKWILSLATRDLVRSQLPDPKAFNAAFPDDQELSALALSNFLKESQTQTGKPADLKFRIGLEESGHCITAGFFTADNQVVTCFAGNGIKTGLNSIQAMSATINANKWYETIAEPFTAGIRKTYYAYYVDKSRLNPGSPIREELKAIVAERFHRFLPEDFAVNLVEFTEEKEMLYWSILENGQQCAAIFIRNSGTEEKSALYLRGEKPLEQPLEQLGMELHIAILKRLKDPSSEFTRFEMDLLHCVQTASDLTALLDSRTDLPTARILKEIEFKEQLIEKKEGNYTLSQRGETFVNAWV